MHTLILILMASLSLLTISLQRTYRKTPLKELKLRAQQGDEIAILLYRAAAYGHSLRAVLWFLVGVVNAAFFLLVALYSPAWFALTVSAALIWVGFVWLPARDVTRFGTWVAAKLAPALAWLLNYLHPIIDRISRFTKRHYPITVHTGLYDKYDLLDLLERQQVQADNRIGKTELEIARRAFSFGDMMIRDVMIPRRIVKTISTNDTLGPVLMSELHENGHSRFPVYETKKDNIVGTLYLHDVMKAKEGGQVKDIMKKHVSYLHEEQSLADALQAVLKTHRHLFVVVNSFEEYVGIITIEDVFEQVVGSPIIDEFDQYEDLRAVAAREAKKEHEEHGQQKEEIVEPEIIEPEIPAESELTEEPQKEPEPEIIEPSNDEPKKVTYKEDDIDEHITL